MASSGVVSGTPAALYAPGGITGLQTLDVAGEIDVTSTGGTLRLSSGSNGVKQINSFTAVGGADDLYLAVNGVAGADVITGQDLYVGSKPVSTGTLFAGEVVTAIPHSRDPVTKLPTTGFVNSGLFWTYSGVANVPAGAIAAFEIGQTFAPLPVSPPFAFQAGDEGVWMLSVRFPDYLTVNNDVSTCAILRVQRLSGFAAPICVVATSNTTEMSPTAVSLQNTIPTASGGISLFCLNDAQVTPPNVFTSNIVMAISNVGAGAVQNYIWSLTKLGV